MKSLSDLLVCLLAEAGGRCGVAVERDVLTLRSRVEHEGDSFITITLADFGGDFDRALALGRAAPGSFFGFARRRSGLPHWLRGFLDRVFDQTSGDLLPQPCGDCVRYIRQICRFGVKVLLPCTEARSQAAVAAYVSNDLACVPLREEWSAGECPHERFDEETNPVEGEHSEPAVLRDRLWASHLGKLHDRVTAVVVSSLALEDEDGNVQVHCVHGPGATVEGYTSNEKWADRFWHLRLEHSGFTRTLAHFGAEKTLWSEPRVSEMPTYVDPADERPVKVTLVPKTLKRPRVIAVEPCCVQFAQQGLAGVLVRALDQGRYTSGRINFRDQRVNQEKALSGSLDGGYATIDLSDASDRVDCDLVDHMFRAAPEKFRRFLWACRSTRAILPGGEILLLRKFASMGSALCFPVESLAFYTIALAARLASRGLPGTPSCVAQVAQGVYVYGDDLCVPADETPSICAALEAFGLKVNYRKTFWTGQFRESCGMDAFAGARVTPVYLRRMPPADRADASGLLSSVATANQLERAGYWRTARLIQDQVERIFGRLPTVPEDSPAIGWHWYSDYVPPSRFNRNLQRREYRCWVARAVKRDDPLEGSGALAKCLRRAGSSWVLPSIDEEHLERTATPHAVALKRGWVAL